MEATEREDLGYDQYGLQAFCIDGIDYLRAENDDAAQNAARQAIKESLWAFRSEFLSSYIPALQNKNARDAFDKMRETLCEDANELVVGMLGDRIDECIDDAIGADGRGHFLATYDGHEVEDGEGFLYRI